MYRLMYCSAASFSFLPGYLGQLHLRTFHTHRHLLALVQRVSLVLFYSHAIKTGGGIVEKVSHQWGMYNQSD